MRRKQIRYLRRQECRALSLSLGDQVATFVRVRLQEGVAGAVPDASTLWSTYSHRPGHSTLATPQDASVDLQYLQASFHILIQTK